MPGFWETMKRLVAGEPVFKADDQAGQIKSDNSADNEDKIEGWKDDTPSMASTVPTWSQHAKPKIYPEVIIEQVECRVKGEDMEVTIQAQNNSLELVMLDKVLMLNTTHEIDYSLSPGQQKEFIVYNGPMPTATGNTHCELRYRSESGDYFSASHNIEYEPEGDKRYSIGRIRFIPPVRDI